MEVKQLNLNDIQDSVLNECFENDNSTFENLIEVDTESTEDVPEFIENQNARAKLPEGVTNEMLVNLIQAGIETKKNTTLLIECNKGLVFNQARKCTCNIPYMDKVQYGYEGFLAAINAFDDSKNTSFSTYATTAVRQMMYNRGNDDVRLVALPRYLSVHNITVQNYIDKYSREFGRQPNEEQVSKGTGIDLSAVQRVMQFNTNTYSFDTPVTSDGNLLLQDTIAGESADHKLDVDSINDSFEAVMSVLYEIPEHDRKLVERINGLNGTESTSFHKLAAEGFEDGKGGVIKSHSTLHRRYADAIDKIRKIVRNKGIENI